ncbi:hypothetical protein [Streptosporangium sp. NPDC049644]|uniref:hypothetical protein n=1 Tax=Streptosporangium sp. NPDC049644 TaxID=3155507 RepID=UPI00342D96C3
MRGVAWRVLLHRRHVKVVIPEKADQAANRKKKGSRGGRPVTHDALLYEDRNTVERCTSKIEEWCGPAFRFGKTPESHLAELRPRGPSCGSGASDQLKTRTPGRPECS